ncbi:U3 small nucleolar RNA-associated protein 18 [Orchesella cincta]|uniref:U3 small nucleolar RNA-associated protein 18 n=1 Tax=Orchesella cincta TaxID=48709 RepID=A0A1D2N2Q5_ORCCI|nr:U3 small nucleolar RNA-associated protein 18 [Orchesella cincta]
MPVEDMDNMEVVSHHVEEEDVDTKSLKSELVPAWYDSDDDILDEKGIKSRRVNLEAKPKAKYEDRLHQTFNLAFGPTPKWADLERVLSGRKANNSNDSDDDEDMDSRQPSSDQKSTALAKGNFEIFRVVDLNARGREEGRLIRCIDFHPKHNVGLVAGNSNVVGLYTVDGTKNPLHQSIKFEKFEIRNASFSTCGQEFYVSSGLFNHFYTYDMNSGTIKKTRPCSTNSRETIRKLYPSPDGQVLVALGHHGDIYLYSSRSKEVITTLKMNGEVSSVTFNKDGSKMLSVGDGQDIFCWDMKNRVCCAKYTDISLQYATQVASSDNNVALGMTSGIVSVYDNLFNEKQDVPSAVQVNPLKSLQNLVTSVSSLKFNSTSEILAMGSTDKQNAIRLVHAPSLTVFPNFPFLNADYGRPQTIAFTPNSGYMAVGGNKGIAYLFRLKKYENY